MFTNVKREETKKRLKKCDSSGSGVKGAAREETRPRLSMIFLREICTHDEQQRKKKEKEEKKKKKRKNRDVKIQIGGSMY